MRTIDQILDYANQKLEEACEQRGQDWNEMNDDEKRQFISELVGETLDLSGPQGPRGRMGPRGPRGQKGNPGACR